MSKNGILIVSFILTIEQIFAKDNLRQLFTCPTPTAANIKRLDNSLELAGYAVFAGGALTFATNTTVYGNVGCLAAETGTPIMPPSPLNTCFSQNYGAPHGATVKGECDAAYASLTALKSQPGTITTMGTDFGLVIGNINPGVYDFGTQDLKNTGTFVLDGLGDPTSEWFFITGGIINAHKKFTIVGSGNGFNVYWLSQGAFNCGIASSPEEDIQWFGNILAVGVVNMYQTCSLFGRAFSCVAAANFYDAFISILGCG